MANALYTFTGQLRCAGHYSAPATTQDSVHVVSTDFQAALLTQHAATASCQMNNYTAGGSRPHPATTSSQISYVSDRDCHVQCRTYPFWPESLTSRHDWEAEALRCEGIRLQSAALPRHHRHSHSGTDHTRHSGTLHYH